MSDDPSCSVGLLSCLHTWQELIGAIVAALVGGGFVLFQVWWAGGEQRDRRAARYASARSTLPLTLSELCRYAKTSADVLAALHMGSQGEAVEAVDQLPPVPGMPTDAVLALATMIEVAPKKIGHDLAAMLAKLQVQNSRLVGVVEDTSPDAPEGALVVKSNIEEFMLDAAELYARASAFFPFARFQVNGRPAPIGEAETITALNLLGLRDFEFERLHATARRRANREHERRLPMWLQWVSRYSRDRPNASGRVERPLRKSTHPLPIPASSD